MTEQQPPPGGYQVPQYAQYPQASADWQMQQPAYQLPTAPDGRPLADAGKRLLARLLDGLFMVVGMVALGLVAVVVVQILVAIFGEGSPVVGVVGVSLIIVLVLGGLYVYEVETPLRWNGQTPGKRILKIAIAPLEPGVPLRRGQLVYRFLVAQVFNILANCFVGYLDALWCLWDKPYQQCLHDKPAKTVVVRTAP